MQEQEQIFFCPEESEIVKAKTCEVQSRILNSFYSELSDGKEDHSELGKVHQCNSACSSSSLKSSRTLPEECINLVNYDKHIDYEILTYEAKKTLSFIVGTCQNWPEHFLTKCCELSQFFKDCPFNSLVEQSIQTENKDMHKGIILTLDYFTNTTTFILFLIWKNIQNENQQDMSQFVSCSNSITNFVDLLIEFRLIEIRNQIILIELLKIIQPRLEPLNYDEAFSPSLPIGMSQNSKQLLISSDLEVLPWSPTIVAQILSLINQAFYADLCIRNIIQKGGLKYYFNRINMLSQYIIYSVVKNPCKHKRQAALGYWIDLAEKLQQQSDLEGLFVVYKYGIQILLKDYLPQMPLLFKHQSKISKINTYYECQIQDNFKTNKSQGFCIPSFQKYQTQIKRLELQAKQIRGAFEQIASLIEELVLISKKQRQKLKQQNHQLTLNEQLIVRFLQSGIQEQMEKCLKIPLEKDTLVYIELIRLSKIMN